MIDSPIELLKQQKRALLRGHARSTDREGLWEVLVTLVPLLLLWGIGAWSIHVSWWITAAATLGITVVLMRVFSLMHECGHGSLFRTQRLNRAMGFAFGVVSGMPQYVWSQHHHFHHQTNGNWDKYRGPLGTLSVDEYEALSNFQQRVYRYARHLALAPIAGFLYLIFHPRVNWMKGSAALLIYVVKRKLAEPQLSFRAHAATFQTRYWKTAREYRHQSANNLVLLSLWALMFWAVGPVAFFAIYLPSVSLAGAIGIVLFTVQHNFDHAYASQSAEWDIDNGALSGTSYLVLPRWLNWATANIGFHHIHHLSASIPCYRLPRCQAEYQHLFHGVTRITLAQIPRHLKCILWDSRAQRITSVRAHRLQKGRKPPRRSTRTTMSASDRTHRSVLAQGPKTDPTPEVEGASRGYGPG
jgi:omega-6 fatty acid desaturase (delta-12 desaturase)